MVIAEQRGSRTLIDEFALQAFARTIRGNVITPADPRYDEERKVFNAGIDRRPAAIVQVADAADVARAIAFAREQGLPLATRAGGHNNAGKGLVDDGLVIDMQLLKSVAVDTAARVAKIGTGLRAGEYVDAMAPYGLVSPVGDAAHTGLGGLTLGGGYGWLSGSRGMVIDNLLAVELVTADGQQLRASATEHPDLFWALRGGSGNFGIATSYEYHLEPMGQVLGGMLAFPLARAAEIMRLYRDFTAAAPDEITTYLILAAPPQFGPLVVLMLCYSGADLEQGQRVIAPLRAAGPVMDMVRPMSYSEMTHLTDPFAPHGLAREEAWINVRGLSDANLDELLATTTPALAQGATLIVKQLNGKAARVDPLATAFPHRNAPYSIVPLAAWLPGQDPTPHRAWVEQMRETVAPITAGVYVNGADGDSLEAAYGINAIRLAGIKRRYDPDNIFDGAVNIPPRQS